jgi:hypothetical protein
MQLLFFFIIFEEDAINRRLYKGLIIVQTAIYRVSNLAGKIFYLYNRCTKYL